MGIIEKIERCHKCVYYQDFKTCSVRDSADKYNKRCEDFMMEYCNLCKCAVTNWGKHVKSEDHQKNVRIFKTGSPCKTVYNPVTQSTYPVTERNESKDIKGLWNVPHKGERWTDY